jgi:hypothetical protein
VKRLVIGGMAAAAILSGGHSLERLAAAERLQLQVSPSVSIAPASVRVRAIVEHAAENRQLEIVADSGDFYRRTVIDLDGDMAPKVNELQLLGIPGGEYEVTATLSDSQGARTVVRRSLTIMSPGGSR